MGRIFKRIIGSILIMSFIFLLIGGCASRVVYVQKGPPPLKVEVRNPAPHPRAVWIPGHWVWKGRIDEYVWIPGHWEAEPKGNIWVPGYWHETPRGWVRVKGHWRR